MDGKISKFFSRDIHRSPVRNQANCGLCGDAEEHTHLAKDNHDKSSTLKLRTNHFMAFSLELSRLGMCRDGGGGYFAHNYYGCGLRFEQVSEWRWLSLTNE